MRPACLLSCSALVMLAFVIRSGADEPNALHSRLINEGPKGWDKWAEAMSHIDAEWDWKKVKAATNGASEEILDWGRRHYYDRGPSRRLHLFKTLPDGQSVESVHVRRGDQYLFRASKATDPGGSSPFVVTEVQSGPPSPSERRYPAELLSPYCIQYLDLRQLIKNPRFQLTSFSSDVAAGFETVRVEFTYRADGDPGIVRFTSGWAELSPGDDWAVQRYRIQAPPAGQFVDQRVHYGPRQEGFRPLNDILKEYFEADGKTPIATETSTFLHCTSADIPEDFFSFTAVGLPEIVKPRTRSYLWFALVTVGLALIIVAVSRRGRLRRANLQPL